MRFLSLSFFGVALLFGCLFAPFTMSVRTTYTSKPTVQGSRSSSSSEGSTFTELSLADQQRQLPLRPRIFPGLKDRSMTIKARSKTKFCCFCKEPGHHVGNCVKALEDRVAHVAVDCARGVHYPFLHGVWRCEWCWEHLDERDVYKNDPALWRRETFKEREKWDRYMDPSLHDWQ